MSRTGLFSFLILSLSLFAVSTDKAIAQPLTVFDDMELDGNASSDLSEDWDIVIPSGGSSLVSSDLINDISPESIILVGGSKDDLCTCFWHWDYGTVPDKDDLTHAYAALYPEQRLYFGASRYANNGESEIGFWFFRDSVAPQRRGGGSH